MIPSDRRSVVQGDELVHSDLRSPGIRYTFKAAERRNTFKEYLKWHLIYVRNCGQTNTE